PSRYSAVCFAASSLPGSSQRFSVASYIFPAIWRCSLNPRSSLPGSGHYFETTGSCTPNHRSVVLSTCFGRAISRDRLKVEGEKGEGKRYVRSKFRQFSGAHSAYGPIINRLGLRKKL